MATSELTRSPLAGTRCWSSTLVASATLVDRLYFAWFLGLGLLVFAFRSRVENWPAYFALHAMCLAVIAALALAATRSRSGARGARVWPFLHDWYPLAAFIVAFEEVATLSRMIVPYWQDDYILRFELWLFGQHPTAWLNQHVNPVLTEILQVGYFSYFVLLMIVGGVFYRRGRMPEFRQVMTASVLAYMLCYVVFIAFPTEGPRRTLEHLHTAELTGGPFHWMVGIIQLNAGVHGNAFPSSHVAAALVAVIFAWVYLPRLGAALTPLLVLLCAGAVYDRYHYFSDIPSGLLVGALASWLVLRLAHSPRWQDMFAEPAARR